MFISLRNALALPPQVYCFHIKKVKKWRFVNNKPKNNKKIKKDLNNDRKFVSRFCRAFHQALSKREFSLVNWRKSSEELHIWSRKMYHRPLFMPCLRGQKCRYILYSVAYHNSKNAIISIHRLYISRFMS